MATDGGGGGLDGERDARARAALADAPPFASWAGIYVIVLGALAGQIILYAALTAFYR